VSRHNAVRSALTQIAASVLGLRLLRRPKSASASPREGTHARTAAAFMYPRPYDNVTSNNNPADCTLAQLSTTLRAKGAGTHRTHRAGMRGLSLLFFYIPSSSRRRAHIARSYLSARDRALPILGILGDSFFLSYSPAFRYPWSNPVSVSLRDCRQR
jgi:hypothetical protein